MSHQVWICKNVMGEAVVCKIPTYMTCTPTPQAYPPVTKHSWLGNPKKMDVHSWKHDRNTWGIVQQTMFDDTRGPEGITNITNMLCSTCSFSPAIWVPHVFMVSGSFLVSYRNPFSYRKPCVVSCHFLRRRAYFTVTKKVTQSLHGRT